MVIPAKQDRLAIAERPKSLGRCLECDGIGTEKCINRGQYRLGEQAATFICRLLELVQSTLEGMLVISTSLGPVNKHRQVFCAAVTTRWKWPTCPALWPLSLALM